MQRGDPIQYLYRHRVADEQFEDVWIDGFVVEVPDAETCKHPDHFVRVGPFPWEREGECWWVRNYSVKPRKVD